MESALLQQMQVICQQYYETVADIRANNRFAEGILGFGNVVQADRCHVQFAGAMEQLLQSDMAQNAGAAEAEAALRLLVDLAREHENDQVVSTMLQAVQGYGRPLVSRLSEAQASVLAEWYESLYPSNQRLPAQKQLLSDLKKAGKVNGKRFPFLKHDL